ncbi:WD40-repeat-containing domain protein [Gautieria morchelliformis]|nr:WD40-repeat-containing domain protein [Gautieria morchelliformis]
MAAAPVRNFAQPGNILGTLWYPTAVPEDPSTFCFLASVRECPVKLLDASDGRLRASYRIVDHRERQIAPHSMAFNSTASRLYCGFQDAIEVFDINYPGEGERIFTSPSKKSRSGLKGIVSSLAFCPDYSGLYAAGTFSSSLVLFAENSQAEIIQSLGGVHGPITQVKFNPMQPHIVYATSRQSNTILGWDIRGDTSIPLKKFERPGLTNQRLSFDLDMYGSALVTGDQDGFISCFDLYAEDSEKPSLRYKAHNDAIAATALHPFKPALLSVSGSRHFNDNLSGTEDASDSSASSDVAFRTRPRRSFPVSRDTSIKLWTFASREANYQVESHLSIENE